jgi:Ca2+-binding EF-hand superfamily protein
MESSMSRFTTLTAATALIGALAAAGTVAAQGRPGHGFGPGSGPGIDFDAIDTDGDGALSAAELQARAAARMGLSDTDGDGMLSRVEIIAIFPDPVGGLMNPFGMGRGEIFADRMLARMGASEAGAIAVDAMAERRVNDMLAMLDTDRDGLVSQEEVDAARSRMTDRREGRSGEGRGRRSHN